MSRILLFLLLSAISSAVAQDAPAGRPAPEARLVVRHDGDAIVVSAEGGAVDLDELTSRWTETTGRNFQFSQQIARMGLVRVVGSVRAAKADADFLFESVLVRAGFALVPTGPEDARLFYVEGMDAARTLKQTAPFVASEDVASLARKPGQVFTTAFVLKSVAASSLRVALQQLLANRNVELASELTSANTIVVTAFGPTLAAIKRLVDVADRPAPTAPVQTETIPLKYAVAAEVAGLVEGLLRAKETPGPRPVARGPDGVETWVGDLVATRVLADSRLNAVIVQGTPEAVAAAKRLVAALDVPADQKPK